MSSPNLNNLIILGCLLSYMNIYFIGLNEGPVSKKLLGYVCAVSVRKKTCREMKKLILY